MNPEQMPTGAPEKSEQGQEFIAKLKEGMDIISDIQADFGTTSNGKNFEALVGKLESVFDGLGLEQGKTFVESAKLAFKASGDYPMEELQGARDYLLSLYETANKAE